MKADQDKERSNNMKRKSSRRSSILKLPRPLEEVQNVSSDERYPRNKRVSFANTIKIKEIPVDQPAHANADDAVPKDENEQPATDDADTVVQISTPIGKKRRRISTDTGMKLQRLSMIPKLERSFCLTEENFEVYEDLGESSKTEVDKEMPGELPPGNLLGANLSQAKPTLDKSIHKSLSMDLTSDHHSSFSLLSPDSLLDEVSCPSAKETTVNAEVSLDFTCAGYGQQQSTSTCNSVRLSATTDRAAQFSGAFSFACDQKPCVTSTAGIQSSTVAKSGGEELDITCTTDTSFLNITSVDPAQISALSVYEQNCKGKLDLTLPTSTIKSKPEQDLTVLGDQLSFACCDSQIVSPRSTLKRLCPHYASEQVTNGSLSLDLTCTTQADETVLVEPSSNDHLNLTHTIPPNETTFVHVSTEKKPKSPNNDLERCGDWLLNTSNDFLVDDPSLSSNTELLTTTVCESSSKLTPANIDSISKTLEVPASALPAAATPASIQIPDNAGHFLNKFKHSGNNNGLESSLIATPEAVQIDKPMEPTVQQFIPIPAMDISRLECSPVNKSVIPSPSAYSKFCAFLDCDRTVLDTTHFSFPESLPASTNEQKAPNLLNLSQYLQQVHTRLIEIEKSLKHRLDETSYVNSHKAITPALTILHTASIQALCAIELLKAYGEVSETCGSTPMPSVESQHLITSEDLNGPLSTKVQWISEMHTLLSEKVYPAVEEVMGIARDIYGWTLNCWSKEKVCLTLAREYEVSFQLSCLQEWPATFPQILSVHIQSSASRDNCDTSTWKSSLIQCTCTADIPKAVFEAQKIISSQ